MSSPVVSPQDSEEAKPVDSRDSGAGSNSGRLPRGIVSALGAVLAVVLVVAVVIAALFSHARFKAPGTATQHSAGPAAAGQTVRLKGMTAAVEARAVQAPLIAGQQVGTLTITKLIPSGTRVRQGDLLVEFDRQAQLRDSIDKQAQADDLNQQVIEAQAKEDAARAKDETEILGPRTIWPRPHWKWKRWSCFRASTPKKPRKTWTKPRPRWRS